MGVNYVHFSDNTTVVNTFLDGVPRDSFELEGHLTGAQVLQWIAVSKRLEGGNIYAD